MKKENKNLLVPQCFSNLVSFKRAFTLAEVLITLGIIGVVAAITIPTLVANYNVKTWSTSANVFEKKLTQALRVMNTQMTLTGHETTKDFVEELSKHIQINKICKNDELLDCFNETIYWGGGTAAPKEIDTNIIKTSLNFGRRDWDTEIIGVQFANGVSALIAYNPITSSNEEDSNTLLCKQDPWSNEIDGTSCLAILYDTSGAKAPNTSGKDLRSINVASIGTGCIAEVNETCYSIAPFYPQPMSFAKCTGSSSATPNVATTAGAYAQSLGIKKCYYDDDRWAGAVEACGGVDKIPTLDQLVELSKFLYNVDTIEWNTTRNLTLDMNKFSSIGAILDNENSFYLWANNEHSGPVAYGRMFSTNYTAKGHADRNDTIMQTICIE